MANKLKKVSEFPTLAGSSLIGNDILYIVHVEGGSTTSNNLTISGLFEGTNNLTSGIKFSNDTLVIESGRIGINKNDPETDLDIAGSLKANGVAEFENNVTISGDVQIGNKITLDNTGSISTENLQTMNLSVNDSLTVHGNAEFENNVTIGGDVNIGNYTKLDNDGTLSVVKLQTVTNSPNSIQSTYEELIKIIYPIGSIYMSTSSTNPNTLFGVGEWTLWGGGRVPVGINTWDSRFALSEKTGGTYDAVVVSHDHEMGVDSPNHTHSGSTTYNGNHRHSFSGHYSSVGDDNNHSLLKNGGTMYTSYAGNHNHTFTTGGVSTSHRHDIYHRGESGTGKNIQPYIVCYMWKRTA